MIYASGTGTTFNSAKVLLDSPSVVIAPRRIETSDPKEVDEAFINTELGRSKDGSATPVEQVVAPTTKPFAKPRGPGRRR
ncbi:hypothetical protein FA13DRAFT_1727473 [Coprinellus micaceus]|uniref:Uncharacterized protein n=1 Tax=Coprinellus micaceus TaxID=71717 RepID=A0A4Y7TPP7_COPMI|nr:hypothetical protein FA13DRAFT_1727473 [Coprinellus micaceus]